MSALRLGVDLGGTKTAITVLDARGVEIIRHRSATPGSTYESAVAALGEMILSAEVPRIVGREIRGAVDRFLAGEAAPDVWAVHPGGRSVLDRVEAGLDLAPSALDASRAVLRDYGNMSSATILFILERMLRDDDAVADGSRLAALAFGPGLTVESALLTKRRAAGSTSRCVSTGRTRRP